MVIHRSTRQIEHRIFREIGEYLRCGDLLVANQSRVIPARLFARKMPRGGKVELLLLARRDAHTWEALVKGRKTPVGTRLVLPDPSSNTPCAVGEVIAWTEAGGRLIRWETPIEPLLDRLGMVPLPPYITTPLADPERYQTVYAREAGSVAAPTAGLHFTDQLLARLNAQGVELAFVTLNIGLDTFRPVETENIEEHRIHTENCTLTPEIAHRVNGAKREGRRVIAVGTTTVRVLETAARLNEQADPSTVVWPFSGPTDLFIYPGFQFRVVDALITNFHLPRSSLLMLVSAFAGRELILTAYEEAKRQGYRFFSFGDAMLIL